MKGELQALSKRPWKGIAHQYWRALLPGELGMAEAPQTRVLPPVGEGHCPLGWPEIGARLYHLLGISRESG